MLSLTSYKGTVKCLNNGYVYVHSKNSLIENALRKIRSKLDPPNLGEHITICYEREIKKQILFPTDTYIRFRVGEIRKIIIDRSLYYVYLIESRDIIKIRTQMKLPHKLDFKGLQIPLHMTIGKQKL